MRRILLLGYSQIAQKRILPALNRHPHTTLVGIASKTNFYKIPKNLPAYKAYKEAIEKADCDTVYISLNNSAHFRWIRYSLEKGKHVICDKPAVLSKKEAEICYRLASDRLIIFEAFPYLYHKQHDFLKMYLKTQDTPLQKVIAHFGFPPLNKQNFRNRYALGGGCIYDIGPYLLSVGQLYFETRAIKLYCSAYKGKYDVPISAEIIIYFGDNKILQGSIGFTLEYRNHLELWGQTFHFSLDRAFSIPPDFKNTIHYKIKDQKRLLPVDACDAFSEMLTHYNNIIDNKSYGDYNRMFLEQAIGLDTMNRSVLTGKPRDIFYEQ